MSTSPECTGASEKRYMYFLLRLPNYVSGCWLCWSRRVQLISSPLGSRQPPYSAWKSLSRACLHLTSATKLHSTFVGHEEQPMQLIALTLSEPVAIMKLQHLSTTEREEEAL